MRRVQLLAEAADLPLRPEWLTDLAFRWAFFEDGIERLAALNPKLPATEREAKDDA